MSNPYLRFTNGALRVRGIQRVEFQEPRPVQPQVVQVATIPVAEPVVVPEPAPAPAPEPVVVPEPAQIAEIPVAEPESKVEAPAIDELA